MWARFLHRIWAAVLAGLARSQLPAWTVITGVLAVEHVARVVLHLTGRAHPTPLDQAVFVAGHGLVAVLVVWGLAANRGGLCAAAMTISSSVWGVWGVSLIIRAQEMNPVGPIDNAVGALIRSGLAVAAAYSWTRLIGGSHVGDGDGIHFRLGDDGVDGVRGGSADQPPLPTPHQDA